MTKTRFASMILICAGLWLLWAGQAQPQGFPSCTGVMAKCQAGITPQSDGSCCMLIPASVSITGSPAPSGCTPQAIEVVPNVQCGATGTRAGGLCLPTGTDPDCGGNVYTPLCQ